MGKYFVNCCLNAGRIWAGTPQITDFRGLGNTCHRLTVYATADTCHRLTIGVNLAIFMVFRRTVSIDAAPTGLRGLGQTRFYIDTEETPKQINPTGLKRCLESSRFPRSIRFG